MAKTYASKEANYTLEENTVARVSTIRSVKNVLNRFSGAVGDCRITEFNPSAKLGPQGQRQAAQYPTSSTSGELLEKIEDFSGDVKAYVSEVEDGEQQVKLAFYSGRRVLYRAEFTVDANTVHWEIPLGLSQKQQGEST